MEQPKTKDEIDSYCLTRYWAPAYAKGQKAAYQNIIEFAQSDKSVSLLDVVEFANNMKK